MLAQQEILATPEMCYYCFDVLRYEYASKRHKEATSKSKKRKTPPLAPLPEAYQLPEFECPLFVGWKKDRPDGGEKLRGCKGTHGSLHLHEGLRQYTLLSAFDDSRFSPVREEELPRLTCSVNLLFAFEKAEHCFDWEVGKHGIRIDFYDSKNVQRSATFLPSVPVQFGYKRRQTLERLVEKAGCDEPLDKNLMKRIKLIRFQSSLCMVSYDEYVRNSKARFK
jgi:uncharacterized protein (TIGR00296 family)